MEDMVDAHSVNEHSVQHWFPGNILINEILKVNMKNALDVLFHHLILFTYSFGNPLI